MLRVQMKADGEPLVLLVPVDKENKLDLDGPPPWLFTGDWDGTVHYGELKMGPRGVELEWWPGGDSTPIDLEGLPIPVGAVFTVKSSEGASGTRLMPSSRCKTRRGL